MVPSTNGGVIQHIDDGIQDVVEAALQASGAIATNRLVKTDRESWEEKELQSCAILLSPPSDQSSFQLTPSLNIHSPKRPRKGAPLKRILSSDRLPPKQKTLKKEPLSVWGDNLVETMKGLEEKRRKRLRINIDELVIKALKEEIEISSGD